MTPEEFAAGQERVKEAIRLRNEAIATFERVYSEWRDAVRQHHLALQTEGVQ